MEQSKDLDINEPSQNIEETQRSSKDTGASTSPNNSMAGCIPIPISFPELAKAVNVILDTPEKMIRPPTGKFSKEGLRIAHLLTDENSKMLGLQINQLQGAPTQEG